ncbi:hypothetical protein LKV13_01060 [Borrelia sp. BU AG58]|uniref:hypothetical protein n=1 Tax=Borrelia sp. BU AG58 TaxID=2887345 RepID=UPI001E328CF2|nr:hypothetical protein [Borrelia sp. BU AG58]UER67407.1 hypothetical protein LKV13_01060 [Borrelia sp. BU AG58]
MLKGLRTKVFLSFFIILCSCEISYPEIRELDYIINYYFTKDTLDYSMSFDFAIRVLNSKDINRFVVENVDSKEFIEVAKDKYSSFFIESVLGKDILYCKDLVFNIADKTFESFVAQVHLFDTGMRVYGKDIVINLSLSGEELASVHDYVYKFKNMAKLNEISGNRVYLIKTPKDDRSSDSVIKIEDITNIQTEDNLDNYIGLYYVGKNSNLFFKLN